MATINYFNIQHYYTTLQKTLSHIGVPMKQGHVCTMINCSFWSKTFRGSAPQDVMGVMLVACDVFCGNHIYSLWEEFALSTSIDINWHPSMFL